MLVLKQKFTVLGWIGVLLFVASPIIAALLYSWQLEAVTNVMRSNSIHQDMIREGLLPRSHTRGEIGNVANYIFDYKIYAALAFAPILGLVFMIIGRKFYQVPNNKKEA